MNNCFIIYHTDTKNSVYFFHYTEKSSEIKLLTGDSVSSPAGRWVVLAIHFRTSQLVVYTKIALFLFWYIYILYKDVEDVYLKNANDKLFVNHSDDEFVKVVEMSVITKKKSAVNNNSPFSEQLSPRLHDQQLLLGLTHLQFGWPSILIHRKRSYSKWWAWKSRLSISVWT